MKVEFPYEEFMNGDKQNEQMCVIIKRRTRNMIRQNTFTPKNSQKKL